MEKTYIFVLGKNPALSLAEIITVLERDHFVFVINSITTNLVLINTNKAISNPQDLLDGLGGTVKLIEQISILDNSGGLEKSIADQLKNLERESKITFGISSYIERPKMLNVTSMGMEIKSSLKGSVSTRFVRPGKGSFLTAPEIKNNKILEKGIEICLLDNDGKIILGKTIAIQDYQSYSIRDYDKPERDAKSGMLPPKLAQIMINLLPEEPSIVYDPFCGTGTILAEAMIKNIFTIGSDKSQKAIEQAKINTIFIKNKMDLPCPLPEIFPKEAQMVGLKDLGLKPDSVVAELYLGPPFASIGRQEDIVKNERELKKLYLDFLKNFYRNIPSVKQLVLAMPFYRTNKGYYFIDIIDEIASIGYTVISPFKDHRVDQYLDKRNGARKSLLYDRPDQAVGREIMVLTK